MAVNVRINANSNIGRAIVTQTVRSTIVAQNFAPKPNVALVELTDTNIVGVQDKQVIQYDSATGKFVANTITASGGGGTTDWGFGIIYTANNNTYANAAAANSQVNFVGESGVVVFANSVTKTITVAGTPGAQGLTVDYGFVNDPIYYSINYGFLS
jgi:hypothetical protein